MASAENQFAGLPDACLILAKGPQGYITKMNPDIIWKTPSATNKLSPPLNTSAGFHCRKFLEVVLPSRAVYQAFFVC